jgi:hypothetical protein
MVSAGNDPSWRTQAGEPSTLDDLITADGQAGRLVELYRNGSVIGFHTHWQSLFSEGRATGLSDLRITLGRIREHLGGRVLWTRCSDLARTVAAQAVARAAVTEEQQGVQVRLSSTIGCPDFTARLRCEREIRLLHAGDRELRRLPDGAATLEPFTWRRDRDEIAWCADLPVGELVVSARGE